ncbi:MAG: sugar ABC transporter ATP-binding protein [Phycisphaeraceae bacterium]|nr:MAG: sugar ABC transporter ATP-binding protein [Phycisphaeraceae bacterium]
MARAPTNANKAAYLFLAPFLVVFAVFTLYPLVLSGVLAVQQTHGPDHARFVGLDNFIGLATDPLFHKALGNTIIYTLGSLLIQLPLALGLAMLLNQPSLRGRWFYRLIFFSPQLMGLVFVAMLAALVFEKRAGLLNQALQWALDGWLDPETAFPWMAVLDGVTWLDFPWLQSFVMPALILVSLWMYIGYNMVYFLAALQSIDKSLVEACAVDGAGPVTRFFAVTVPSIRPVASFVVLLSLIGSLQLFELPYILLDQTAGPQNRGLTIVMYLYQSGFEAGDLGYASAIGWVLALMLVALALGQVFIMRREER